MGRDFLRGCLTSLALGTVRPVQVIVVDQGSNPNVTAFVKEAEANGLDVQHVVSRERGAAAGRNRGIERVRTRWLAMTDDDCHVDTRWLERLAAHLAQRPDAIVTGRVEPLAVDGGGGYAPSLITDLVSREYRHPPIDRDPLFPNNMGAALEVVERVGKMDEHPSVRYAEDVDWGYRALVSGVPIIYAPDVIVGHLAWQNRGELFTTHRRYARSQGAVYGHYLRKRHGVMARRMVRDLLRGPWMFVRGVASGNGELADMGRAYVTELVPGIVAGWRRSSS